MNDTGFKFEDFPKELQIYILSRLRSKPLSRSRCVSKHWNTTLTIQAFMFRHALSHDKHSKLAFVFDGYNKIFSYELSDNKRSTNTATRTVPKTTKITVEGEGRKKEVMQGHQEHIADTLSFGNMSNICNGLICHFDCNPNSRHLGLLNIKTRDFIHLPALTREGDRGDMKFWFALGFDPVIKVYKVLSIYSRYKECGTKAAILTIGSKHWKQVEYKFLRCDETGPSRFWQRNNMFCVDGVIYWVNDYEFIQRERVLSLLTVVAFDLNREVFTDYKLDRIPIKGSEKIRYYLTSLKGYPTLFIWKKGSNEIQQLTLFKDKNTKAAWNRRSFIANDFLKIFSFGRWGWVAGGSILLESVNPEKSSIKPEEQDNPFLSWYTWYDLENLAIE